MGRLYLMKLDGRIYSCRICHTPLAKFDELMSKSFHCRHGKAYLFNSVVNITVGENEERIMTTGIHVVADIYCNCCHQNVGWKYVSLHSEVKNIYISQEIAYDEGQKYKEGKFILERARIDGDCKEANRVASDADDV